LISNKGVDFLVGGSVVLFLLLLVVRLVVLTMVLRKEGL
jgi:hypothetical protein